MTDNTMSPQQWLWHEIARRIGDEAAAEIHEAYLARMRAYMRARNGSPLPLDAPKQRAGRPRLQSVDDNL